MPVKPGQPDDQSARQVRTVRFPQDNHRQPFAETVQDHERDMTDEEQDERAKSQEMQTPRGLPPVKDFDIPRETGGDGGGHRDAGRNAERREQEYDGRVASVAASALYVPGASTM